MFKKLLLSAAFVLSMSAAAEARTVFVYQQNVAPAPVYYAPAPAYYQPVSYDPFFPLFSFGYYGGRYHDRGNYYHGGRDWHHEAPRHNGPHGRW